MKDAVGGERAGEVPNNLRSGRFRMGEPPAGHAAGPTAESIGGGRAPWELKHLSTRWKRNQTEIPLVVASERGRAQTARA